MSSRLAICGSGPDDVVLPQQRRPLKDGRVYTKFKELWRPDSRRSKTPPPQWRPVPSSYTANASGYQWSGRPGLKLPPVSEPQDTRHLTASSSRDYPNGSREDEGYQIRAPPPGSYQDDDTGPSPKNLVMAVMGVKSAVNYFAKALISDMNKHPQELKLLKQTIHRVVQSAVDRPNHWKFLVQAFVCKRLFEDFEAPNGFFGIEQFSRYKMTHIISFQDFSKYKDKAGTISTLLAKDSPDTSFLGRFCFKKFKSISGDLNTNQPLSFYQEEWRMVEQDQHPKSGFYQSFLKVAVSVWLLHRLVHSFEQSSEMLGWKKFPQGSKFERRNMESVVPGGFEEEDDETGTDVNTVVGFLVIPGFQVSKSVVKCEVYLRNKNDLDNGKIMEADGGKIMEATETPSRDKSLQKSFSDKTHASVLTPQSFHTDESFQTSGRVLSDRGSDRSLHIPDSVKSSSNRSERAAEASISTSRADGLKAGTHGRSPPSGSKNRDSSVTKHFLPKTSTSWNVARDTALSKQRREESKSRSVKLNN